MPIRSRATMAKIGKDKRTVLDLALAGFLAALLVMGLKRPFIWVLAFIYVDIVAPQKIGWGFMAALPASLLVFVAAFAGWLLFDGKKGTRFTFRQFLMVVLLAWCAYTTLGADFPEEAATKWAWVWKSLVFAIFLPLTLRTQLRLEATALIMVLAGGSIIVSAGIKTVLSGGGYGALQSYVGDNTGLYEGSTLSMVAISIIPLIVWLARHGTIFPPDWRVKSYALCLGFACLLVPVGTQTRTGLVCIAVLAVLSLRYVKQRFLLLGLMGAIGLMAIPFLPQSYVERMSTITDHQADESASTRIAVWKWTLDYVGDNPMGGGFDAYLGNSFKYKTRHVGESGSTSSVEYVDVVDEGRAYHSAYFEVLGEQGWPGLFIWMLLQGLGLIQLEFVQRRLRKSNDKRDRANASLANALQVGHAVYLVGALFVGIAYQPFIYMLVALQIGLVLQIKRNAQPALPERPKRERRALKPVGAVEPT